MPRKDIRKIYMKMAVDIAEMSYSERKRVGAVIVKDGRIISLGFNGTPKKFDNVCEINNIEEEWRYFGIDNYEVSSFGRIRVLEHIIYFESKSKNGKVYLQKKKIKERILPESIDKKGYVVVKIDGTYKKVHQIVANTFIYNPDKNKYNQINHIDFDKKNNRAWNLEWCTNRYNCSHRSNNLKCNDLPAGISFSKRRNKYVAQIYIDGRTLSKRFDKLEDAVEYRQNNTNESDFLTYRFNSLITKPEVIHAECNAICKVARSNDSCEGAELYVTMACCVECAKLVIQSGISKVYFLEDYRLTDGKDLLIKAGIDVEQILLDE